MVPHWEGDCSGPHRTSVNVRRYVLGLVAGRKGELLTFSRWGPGVVLNQLQLLMANTSSAEGAVGKLGSPLEVLSLIN